MPKAEVGSVKYLNNKLRSRGLGRLRWYCQVCEKQCPDAHGFSMHTKSESHVRRMLVVGEDPRKAINEFSKEFLRDFLQLLKTGHGEKSVHINKFYQEYIANKEHIHMNSTKWASLTEFAKFLGREGICRVEENDKGLHIAWIDDSPEALRRREALKRKEAQDQGNEQFEQRIIREQIKRAQAAVDAQPTPVKIGEQGVEERAQKLKDGEKISLSFGSKPAAPATDTTAVEPTTEPITDDTTKTPTAEPDSIASKPPVSLGGIKLGSSKPQVKNVFAAAKKKNALGGASPAPKKAFEQPKKMSEVERIMREEQEKKRSREAAGFGMPGAKKQRSG